jgi:hypothetical protein
LIFTGCQAGHQLPVELYLIRVAIGWLVKDSGALIGWRFSHLHFYSGIILIGVIEDSRCSNCVWFVFLKRKTF